MAGSRQSDDDISALTDQDSLESAGAALLAASGGDGHDPNSRGLGQVAQFHLYRYRRLGTAADLMAAVALAVAVEERRPEDVPEPLLPVLEQVRPLAGSLRPAISEGLSSHAEVQFAAWTQLRRTSSLNMAIDCWQAALDGFPASSESRPTVLSNLSLALLERYWAGGVARDLSQADNTSRAAVKQLPAVGPARSAALLNRFIVLRTQVTTSPESRASLDAAIDAGQALLSTPVHDQLPFDPAEIRATLADLLFDRFKLCNGEDDLERALTQCAAATEGAAPAHKLLYQFFGRYAQLLDARHDRRGARDDLDQAIAAYRKAIAGCPKADANLPRLWHRLGLRLRARFERDGSIMDVDDAIAAATAALAITNARESDLGARLVGLGSAFLARYDAVGEPAAIESAVARLRQAAESATSREDTSGTLSTLGLALRRRFEANGLRSDLEEAIAVGKRAVDLGAVQPIAAAQHRVNLALSLRTRFELTLDDADIDAAVQLLVVGREAGSPNHMAVELMAARAIVLSSRYRATGAIADIDAAVDASLGALAIAQRSGIKRLGRYLLNAGANLLNRYERTQTISDLTLTTQMCQAAVDAAENDGSRAAALSNLAVAVESRFYRTRKEEDLDSAIDACRRAVASVTDEDPNRGTYLVNLTRLVLRRYEANRNDTRLDDTIATARDAVAHCPDGHPYRYAALLNLGLPLVYQLEQHPETALAAEARRLFITVADHTGAPVADRMRAARGWGTVSAVLGDWHDAVGGYERALDLLDLLAWYGLLRADRLHSVSRVEGIGTDAAAVAIASGQASHALVMVERGRGVVFGQDATIQASLMALHNEVPKLADELKVLLSRAESAFAWSKTSKWEPREVSTDLPPR